MPAHGCTVADVLRATAFVSPSIEIIDSRFDGWNITLCDTIADNASSARVVVACTLKNRPARVPGYVAAKRRTLSVTMADG